LPRQPIQGFPTAASIATERPQRHCPAILVEGEIGDIGTGSEIHETASETWRRVLEKALAADRSEVVPYKILPTAIAAVASVVKSRLQLFSSAT
jgi:hypothetical protein